MNPVLLGDEMLQWSDAEVARGAVFGSLVASAGGRTLVAGPHHPDLIAGIAADSLTLLVRGVADGEALADRFPAATVCCGGLAKFTADEPFDTVIALAGLERLISAEGVEQPWAQTLDQLLALLRPGGTLVLAVENHFGLHRLVRLPGAPRDEEWTAAAGCDPTRPRGPDQLRERLGGAVRGLVGYPDPLAPTLLLATDVLADDRVAGAVAALLTRTCEPAGPGLMDPRPVAVGAARHGAAAALAPVWICTSGPVPEPELPAGPTLQDLLLRAALQRDLPAVRGLLGAWLDGPAAGVPADQVVVGPGGQLTALLLAGHAAVVGEPGAALRRFAAFLIDGGYAHPWPAPAGAADLAATLAAMTGRELAVPAPADDEPPPGYRELLLARERLTAELAQARARHQWYEQMLVDREAELKRVRRINQVLAAAAPGRALLSGARAVRRAVRQVRRN
jgi:hypothetical protein